MIIHVKQACEFVNEDGQKYTCPYDFIGTPPEWVQYDRFFKSLAASGLITTHIDTKSVDADLAKDEKKKRA